SNITLQIWPRRESQRGKVPLPLQQYVEHFKEKTLSGHFNEIEKSILYCRELNDVGRFFVLLRKLLGAAAVDAEDPDDRTICVYYAGIDLPSERLALARFAEGKAKLMITTVAFGLGINIPDVRRVYHYGAPATVLEYWQEIGRCGRDGSQGRAILIDCFVPGFQSPIPALIRDCEEKKKCFRVALLSYLWVGNNSTPQVPSSTCCSFCML
ncbi:hypothetical protein CAPTEDRAFT_213014, partial [Capitella teleta]